MDTVNAIAKARFASARPQRVQLHKDEAVTVEMLCLEPGQSIPVRQGRWSYYVIAGTAVVEAEDQQHQLQSGHVAVATAGERHTLTNVAETRLICLAVGCGL